MRRAASRRGSVSRPSRQQSSQGGAFTVSNLGLRGVARFNAVIYSPQVAILAVGAVSQRAVVDNGSVTARPIMEMSLTCDHRVVYGADAADFLTTVRSQLEDPALLGMTS